MTFNDCQRCGHLPDPGVQLPSDWRFAVQHSLVCWGSLEMRFPHPTQGKKPFGNTAVFPSSWTPLSILTHPLHGHLSPSYFWWSNRGQFLSGANSDQRDREKVATRLQFKNSLGLMQGTELVTSGGDWLAHVLHLSGLRILGRWKVHVNLTGGKEGGKYRSKRKERGRKRKRQNWRSSGHRQPNAAAFRKDREDQEDEQSWSCKRWDLFWWSLWPNMGQSVSLQPTECFYLFYQPHIV